MAIDLVALRSLLRDHALSLPEATEDFPWGESVAKVRGKVFVFLGRDPTERGELSFAVKLPQSGVEALGMAFTSPTAYGLGTKGWVTATVTRTRVPPREILLAWIEESWSAVAPKRVVKAREAESGEPVAKPARKAARPATKRAPVKGK